MRKRLENNVSEAKTGTLECAGARYGFGRTEPLPAKAGRFNMLLKQPKVV